MAESTCLESMRRGNSTVGSNPTLSAKVSNGWTIDRGAKRTRRGHSRGWDLNEGARGGEAPPRGEPTRGLAPSVGARGETARATSNAHPLRQSWRDRNRQFINQRAVARQAYQQAMRLCAEIRCRVPRLLLKSACDGQALVSERTDDVAKRHLITAADAMACW